MSWGTGIGPGGSVGGPSPGVNQQWTWQQRLAVIDQQLRNLTQGMNNIWKQVEADHKTLEQVQKRLTAISMKVQELAATTDIDLGSELEQQEFE